MATVIWKYPLALTYEQTLSLPLGCRLVHVGAQRDTICLWCAVDPEETEKTTALFFVVPTGTAVPWGYPYIGTVMLRGGALVFHIFEGGRVLSKEDAQ